MSSVLYVAWRSGDDSNGRWGPVGRLDRGADGYRFVYTRGAATMPGFVPFAGMESLRAIYESDELFPLFANRLLARSRPEYEAFLTWGGFDPKSPPDPIALLGVTEGRRFTDSFEVFTCAERSADGRYNQKFFLHGVRHTREEGIKRVESLCVGERLTLRAEPDNPQDPHAIAVLAATTADGVHIGYVPRYLARDIGQLAQPRGFESIHVTVERINKHAPLQHRVLCRLSAHWPESFHPCTSEEYLPLVPVGQPTVPA